MSRPFLRWAAPAGVVTAMLGLVVGASAIRATADPALPARDAAQLLVDLQTARLESFSGTVVLKADLGLPPIVEMATTAAGSGGGQPLLGLLNGSHTIRVWYAGPEKIRLALLDTLGESDIIRNGQDLWIWSSRDQTAAHEKLPAGSAASLPTSVTDLLPGRTPQEVANAVLAAVEPTTVVTTAGTAEIAGRAAYELILAPRDQASLISQIRIAIDGEKRLPLRVRVLAKGSTNPAFEIGFQQVNFSRPGDEHFQFNPPPGTKVQEQGDSAGERKPGNVEKKPGAVKPDATKPDATKPDATKPDATKPGGTAKADPAKKSSTVVGETWTSVLVARTDMLAGMVGADGEGLKTIIGMFPRVSGAWGGGHLFTSRLVNGLVTDDGRVLIGAVTPERLYAVAADPAAALK